MHIPDEGDSIPLAKDDRSSPMADIAGLSVSLRRGKAVEGRPIIAIERQNFASGGLDERDSSGNIPDVRALEARDAKQAGGDEGALDRGRAGLSDLEGMQRGLREVRLA